MNPYILGGGVLIIAVMGWLLKGAYERTGELEAKLAQQANETLECADANASNQTTITELESALTAMVEERRVDAARREEVLADREQELVRARMRADELERERELEQEENIDCAALAELDVAQFCPATANSLRQRSLGAGGDGDGDG